MNAVDATSREERTEAGPPPALLTIILDTNPHAWNVLSSTLPLSKLVANLLVFVNAHIAINNSNRVAVIASHTQRAQFLYPTPTLPKEATEAHTNGHSTSNGASKDIETASTTASAGPELESDANKYRPFASIESAITRNLRALLSSTTAADLSAANNTMLSSALTMALSYISKQTLNAPASTDAGYDGGGGGAAGAFNPSSADGSGSGAATTGLNSRILVLSVSGDLAQQYIPIMNSIFACQRLGIPIDILTLSPFSKPEFLQQAADATGGIFTSLGEGDKYAGILQVLMMAYLPDQSARRYLVQAGEEEGVDFRAACFCHGRIVDLGWVCSICLSIFCEPLSDNTCLTCGSYLTLANYGQNPIVVPRKKKKKKKLPGGGIESGELSRAQTPGSNGDVTPLPG
ncbi:hypothetical protein MBLNU459_g1881t1 [Dothideomycetes sp. NU459]